MRVWRIEYRSLIEAVSGTISGKAAKGIGEHEAILRCCARPSREGACQGIRTSGLEGTMAYLHSEDICCGAEVGGLDSEDCVNLVKDTFVSRKGRAGEKGR